MKKSLVSRPIKQVFLAVPAAALMLGAAQAGTTVGLNFQAWYYDSHATPQTVGYGAGYQTTGFPVTANAFGVDAANWANTDPLPCQAVISGYATFGGVNTTFGGGLTANLSAPNAWQSGIGELVAGWHPETVVPGNDEVTWGYLDDGNVTGQAPSVTVSGLAAKFPNGYVVQTITGGSGAVSFDNVDITDGNTTNVEAYSTYYVANTESDGYVSGGTVGLSAPSGVFTSNTISINPEPKTASHRSTLAGFIITDMPVVSLAPVGGSYVAGETINLTAGAIGIPPLSYQWLSNGIPVSGATSTSFSLPNAAAGSYNIDVVATNLYGASTSSVATVTVAVPATVTWDSDRSTTGVQDGSGTWDNGTTANWWNGSADVVWGNVDNAVFGAGGTGAYTVTLTNGVTANSLTFNSGNYTLAGSGAGTLTLAGTAQVVANTNATISLALAGTVGLTKTGAGTLAFSAQQTYTGGTVVNAGILDLTGGGGSSGTIRGAATINAGGMLQLSTGDAVGYAGGSAALTTINLVGGTLNVNTTANQTLGGAIINLTGGAIMGNSAGNLDFFLGGSALNTLASSTTATISGVALSPLRQGSTTFTVAQGTTASGIDLDISSVLRVSPSGDATGSALIKAGAGTMRLSAVNTYTGGTTIQAGELILTGQLLGTGAVTVDDGATLIASGGAASAIPNANTLSLGSAGTLTLGFNGLNNTTVPVIAVNSMTVNDRVTVNITGNIASTGTFPLIQYAGESGSGSFVLGSLPPGVSATLADDHSSSVSLHVTATPVQTEVWSGSPNGNWDINNTANWLIGASASAWYEGNIAVFDDTAAGTTTITLMTNVHPAIVTFTNSTKNYSITGSGSIAGAASLTVNGTATVTLGSTNTYAGGTIVNAGTLSVSADSNLGSGALTLNGGTMDIAGATAFASAKNVTLNGTGTAIQVDNPAGADFTTAISGGGALTKTGTGALTLSALEGYTGGTVVNGGTLNLAYNSGGSGTLQGALTINTNATVVTTVNNALGYSGANWVQNITINYGTLSTAVTTDNGWGTTINMTGGTLGTLVPNGYFAMGNSPVINVTGVNVPSVISADLTVRDDAAGIVFNVTRGTGAVDLIVSGKLRAASTGGVTLGGGGIIQLAAVNNYTGGTEVQSGMVILSGQLIGGGSVTVDDGATLVASAGTQPAILNASDLNLGGGASLTLGFADVNDPAVPVVTVTNLTVNDAVTVDISGHVGVGHFPLIKYAGSMSGTGSFALGTLPVGVGATLSNNVASQSIDLVVTSAPLSIIVDIAGGTNDVYAGANYTLAVTAGGNPTLGYQWYQNNSPIQGATSATLALTRLSAANDGSYYVIVTNASGSISSSTNHLLVLPVSGYAALDIATGPTAYWPLDESAGPTAVDYMGGHNAGYSGTGVTFNVPGPVGTSVVTVDGSSGQVACSYSPDLNPAGAFTAEAWLKPASVTASLVCALSSVHAASPRAGWLIYESTAGWEFRTYNQNGTSTAVDITGGTPTVGEWDHVAVVWDGSYGYIYVNGVLKNTSAATNYVANSDGPVTIGSRSDSSFYWGGSVGDVALYNRVLTPQEIQTHAQNRPSFALARSGGNVVLSWVPSGGGVLLASPTVNGVYTNVSAATSPWTNRPSGNQFYRLKF